MFVCRELARIASLCVVIAAVATATTTTTIHNDTPRLDTDGNIIDCHSGNIIVVNGTFYMYGEHYGNSTGFGPSPPQMFPKLVVYTSVDAMQSWTFRGFALSNWPTKPYGTFFTPWAVYNTQTNMFVLWFNAYMTGCCLGGWGVAQSSDGLAFDVVTLNETGVYPQADGNALLVDDDGSAYIAYTSEAPGPGLADHRVSIEKLTADYLHTTRENYGLFPESYVEGAILFKQDGLYYVMFGSCCCFCRSGSGAVVYRSSSVKGPWTRQPVDVNCNSNMAICGGYGARVQGDLIINAQGIGLSVLPTAHGTTLLWHGERWLSALDNNPQCPDECRPTTGECAEPDSYIKGNGFSYWIPIQFSGSGDVMQFQPFVNTFNLTF